MISNLIRRLPPWAEFCLVILVCSWWGIYASIQSIATQSWNRETFAGIGVAWEATNQEVVIRQVMPGTPAAAAGLSSNLVIQKIDGVPLEGTNYGDYMKKVRGQSGSEVRLDLFDPANNRTNTVALHRQRILDTVHQSRFTNHTGLFMTCCEIFGLFGAFWIARIRQWPMETWGFRPSWKRIGAGFLVYLATITAVAPIALFSNHVSPGIVHRHFASHLSVPVLVVLACLNPFFEETLEIGYFVQTFQRYGMWVTVLASAFFRAFMHAYQGIDAVLVIFPLGLLYALIYWRWRCLWPLFIAHALLDFVALLPR